MKKRSFFILTASIMCGILGMPAGASEDLPIVEAQFSISNEDFGFTQFAVSATLPESGIYIVTQKDDSSIIQSRVVSTTDDTLEFITTVDDIGFDYEDSMIFGIHKMTPVEDCSFAMTCEPLTFDEETNYLSSELTADTDSEFIVSCIFTDGENKEHHYLFYGSEGKAKIGRELFLAEQNGSIDVSTDVEVEAVYLLSDRTEPLEFSYQSISADNNLVIGAAGEESLTGIAVLTIGNASSERKYATSVDNEDVVFYMDLWGRETLDADDYVVKSVDVAKPDYILQFSKAEYNALKGIEEEAPVEEEQESESASSEMQFDPEEDILADSPSTALMPLYFGGYISDEFYTEHMLDDEITQEVRDALIQFQQDNGLTANGYTNQETVYALMDLLQEISNNMQ